MTFKNRYHTIIVGGGAAGVMAAALIAQAGHSVLLLEKMEKPSRKVRITGKGRCNLTNDCTPEQFMTKVRSGEDFFEGALNMFTPKDCIAFFEKIGVSLTVERGGRVFPSSMKAAEIADKLEAYAKECGAEIICNAKVVNLNFKNNKVEGAIVEIGGEEHKLFSNFTILATGGLSYPSTGSTGDGYHFAHNLGHEIEPLRPSLTSLAIECRNLESLDRLVLKNINLKLFVDGKEKGSEFGELEFFTYGLGGATTLRLSRKGVDALIEKRDVEAEIDLKPALSIEQIVARIGRECDNDSELTLYSLLRKLMPKQVVPLVAQRLKMPTSKSVHTMGKKERETIARSVKSLRFKVNGYGDFSRAIVTAGGVSLHQVDMYTMASTVVRGLYFAGEILDLDADTGGYNLQIAYSTAFAAANAIGNF